MKAEHIMDALNHLDDDIIESVEEVRSKKSIPRRSFRRWAGLAACLCVMITVLFIKKMESGQNESASEDIVEEEAAIHVAEDSKELPQITISEFYSDGMGYEAYLDYDGAKAETSTTQKELLLLRSLPVYKNLNYKDAGIPYTNDTSKIQKMLRKTAASMGAELIEIKEISGLERGLTSKMITDVIGVTSFGEINVSANGSIHITFTKGFDLPEEYHFHSENASVDEIEKSLTYLLREFHDLLSFKEPEIIIEGDYDIYGKYNYSWTSFKVYDAGGDENADIINQYLNYVYFVPNDEGKLESIHIYDGLYNHEKIGDYPIITEKQAKKLLLNGNYITSVPYEIAGEEYIEKVELMYRNSYNPETKIPYYRFYVKLPETERENGLISYGAYYVPAVEEQYIENMPLYEGGFNY